jgi:hypothetical protein
MLDSSTNHSTQLASGIGGDQDEDVATNKYPRWSSGGRHRCGAHRRSVAPGEDEEDGVPPLTGGSRLLVEYRIGIQTRVLLGWLAGLRPGMLFPIFSVLFSFLFTLFFVLNFKSDFKSVLPVLNLGILLK